MGFLPLLNCKSQAGSIEDCVLFLPMRKIGALGGGGGTIAKVNSKRFKLGPESAGAAPGPACFGFGGIDGLEELIIFVP